MAILSIFNEIKDLLTRARDDIDDLPEEIREETESGIDRIYEDINNTGFSIEKHFQDQESFERIKSHLLSEMKEDSLYGSVSLQEKEKIAEVVIEDASIDLIAEDEFREYLLNYLRSMDTEGLATHAYSRDDIIRIGLAVIGEGSTSTKYTKGLDVVKEMIETPMGRQDAISHGEKIILENPKVRKRYLLQYYGV